MYKTFNETTYLSTGAVFQLAINSSIVFQPSIYSTSISTLLRCNTSGCAILPARQASSLLPTPLLTASSTPEVRQKFAPLVFQHPTHIYIIYIYSHLSPFFLGFLSLKNRGLIQVYLGGLEVFWWSSKGEGTTGRPGSR